MFRSMTRLDPADAQARALGFARLLAGHLRRQGLAWGLAILVFALFETNYRLGINVSDSLPQTLFLIHLNEPVGRGDYAAFRYHGGPPYPDGTIFVKRVGAAPGDPVVRAGRHFTIGGVALYAQEWGLTGAHLFPNPLPEGESTIPPGKLFVMGSHEYSLDSRYSQLGLVDQADLVGRAHPLF